MASFRTFAVVILVLHYGVDIEAYQQRMLHFPDEEGNILPTDVGIRVGAEEAPRTGKSLLTSRGLMTSIPSDYDPELNNLSTMDDFASFFEISSFAQPEANLTITSRFGGIPLVEELPQANCIEEYVTVDLPLTKERGVTHFPTCVRVKRCGGCCFIPQHSCQPLLKEIVQVRVMKVKSGMTTSSRERRRGRRVPEFQIVDLERHLKCMCGCTVKEDSCNPLIHVYNKNKCSCECNNIQAEADCLNSSTHHWDNDACKCLCRNTTPCSTGQDFSHASCSCV